MLLSFKIFRKINTYKTNLINNLTFFYVVICCYMLLFSQLNNIFKMLSS